MATNTSNSNFVNISLLPAAQIAGNNDLLILQTQNGTQNIQFQDFNVVRTDGAGNATVVGDISGNKAIFTDINVGTIRTNTVYADDTLGTNTSFGYQNRYQVTNGIIISSDYAVGSPEYNTLYGLYQSLSANSSQAYKKVFQYSGVATINNGAITSSLINVGGFPVNSGGVSIGNLLATTTYSSYFRFTPYIENDATQSLPTTTPGLSAFTYYSGTGVGDDNILFCVALGSVNGTGRAHKIGVSIVYFYN
jgi:hypothetical protein